MERFTHKDFEQAVKEAESLDLGEKRRGITLFWPFSQPVKPEVVTLAHPDEPQTKEAGA